MSSLPEKRAGGTDYYRDAISEGLLGLPGSHGKARLPAVPQGSPPKRALEQVIVHIHVAV